MNFYHKFLDISIIPVGLNPMGANKLLSIPVGINPVEMIEALVNMIR
jgi:hypothetical protein